MVKKNNQVIFDRNEVIKFLAERQEAIIASGARVIKINEKAKELKEEVEKTNKKLRFLL